MLAQRYRRARGSLRGVDKAFLDLLFRFQAGQIEVPDVVAFPVDMWHWYAWHEQYTSANIAAGSSTRMALYTVPQDRRALVVAVRAVRSGGDNTAVDLDVTQPAGYGTGNRLMYLLSLSTPATEIYWPSRSLTVSREIPGGTLPVLIEPGGSVGLTPSGAGAAISTFDVNLMFRLSPIVRARAAS